MIKKKLKTYTIPCFWQSYGKLNIEAESLEDAIEIAESDEMGLPTDFDYLTGSFEVDVDAINLFNEEEEDYEEDWNDRIEVLTDEMKILVDDGKIVISLENESDYGSYDVFVSNNEKKVLFWDRRDRDPFGMNFDCYQLDDMLFEERIELAIKKLENHEN